MTLISIPAYQVNTMDRMLLYVDTEATISSIGDKLLKTIIYSVGRKSIPMIQFDRDFQFRSTVIKSQGIVELLLPTTGHIKGIP